MRRAVAFVVVGVAVLAGAAGWLTHPAAAGFVVGPALIAFGLLHDWEPDGGVDDRTRR